MCLVMFRIFCNKMSAHLLWPARPFHIVGSMCKDSSSTLVHVHYLLCHALWTINLAVLPLDANYRLWYKFTCSIAVCKLISMVYSHEGANMWFIFDKLLSIFFHLDLTMYFCWQSVPKRGAVGDGRREQRHGMTHLSVAWSPTSRWWSWSRVWPRTGAWPPTSLPCDGGSSSTSPCMCEWYWSYIFLWPVESNLNLAMMLLCHATPKSRKLLLYSYH
jgi:hypothetical protein